MSKLLLQLKQAQALREQARGEGLPADAEAPTQAPDAAAPAPSRVAATRRFPMAAAGLALVIFVAVVLAWRAAPFRAPSKVRIDPASLKLEHRLDITRLRQTTPQ